MFDDPSMPWRLNRTILLAAFIALLVVAGLCDRPLALWALGVSPRIGRIGAFVTSFGLSGYMFLISAAIFAIALWRRSGSEDRAQRRRLGLIAERAAYFFAAIGTSGILAQIIKHIVGRNRPKLLLDVGPFHFDPFSLKTIYASFPSGHTTSAFAAAVALTYIAPGARGFWFLAAVAIGLSRVIVHAHYPSDVVAGAGLGAVTAFAVARAFAARSIAFDPTSPVPRLKSLGAGLMPGRAS